ncbi:MAG TPA: hypothetical protein VFQ80_03035 [Thermomicrobiales bacterium]|nr:hypothetical protein [Thermomicrobiales bacterium]
MIRRWARRARPPGLLREPDFARYWTAGAVSFAGSAVTTLALAIVSLSPARGLRQAPAPLWEAADA